MGGEGCSNANYVVHRILLPSFFFDKFYFLCIVSKMHSRRHESEVGEARQSDLEGGRKKSDAE